MKRLIIILYLFIAALSVNAQIVNNWQIQSNYDSSAYRIIELLNVTNGRHAGAINKAVIQLKNTGIWDKIVAVYPFYDSTATSHRINWKNTIDTSFRLIFRNDNDAAHGPYGYTPNGSTQYADSKIKPFTNLQKNNLCILSKVYSFNIPNSIMVGAAATGNTFLYLSNGFSGTGRANYNTVQASGSVAIWSGYWALNRTSSTYLEFRHNLDSVGTNVNSDVTDLCNQNIYIGCLNNNGTPAYYYNKRIEFVSISEGLSANEYIQYISILDELLFSIKDKQQVLIYGNSITLGSYATPTPPFTGRWTEDFASSRNYTEVNYGISGSTLNNTIPKNLAAPSNFRDTCSYIVPNYVSYQHALLLISYGVNDIGFNWTNSTVDSFKICYREVLNIILSKRWPRTKIKLITPSYYNQTGRNKYLLYGVPVAADLTRHLAFVQAVIDVGIEYNIQTADIYNNTSMGDSDLYDDLHPNLPGHGKIGNYLKQFFNN